MANIITTRTKAVYLSRPNGSSISINRDSKFSVGLLGWWPMFGLANTTINFASPGRCNLDTSNINECYIKGFGGGGTSVYFHFDDYYLAHESLITTFPISISCWVNINNTAYSNTVFAICDGNTFDWKGVSLKSVYDGSAPAGLYATASSDDPSGTPSAQSTKKFNYGEDAFMTGVWAAADDRRAYLNGQYEGTSSASRVLPTLNKTCVKCNYSSFAININGAEGQICDICVWNRALSKAEIYQMYEPGTRWSLYYQLGRRVYPKASVVAAGGGIYASTNIRRFGQTKHSIYSPIGPKGIYLG